MPKKRKQPNLKPWTAEELAMLGIVPDNTIAKQFNRSQVCVRNRRVKLGIPVAAAARRISWGPTELASFRLGYSDDEIVRMTSRSIEEVRAKRAELVKG